MARGTVNGEAVVSQAGTDEFREGYERVFGDRKPQRGRWVWDAEAGKLVPSDQYVSPAAKCGTTVMVDRWREGDKAPDGTDIGSRSRRNAWMKETGNAPYEDFATARARRSAEESAKARGEFKPDPKLRHLIGQQLYKQKVIL